MHKLKYSESLKELRKRINEWKKERISDEEMMNYLKKIVKESENPMKLIDAFIFMGNKQKVENIVKKIDLTILNKYKKFVLHEASKLFKMTEYFEIFFAIIYLFLGVHYLFSFKSLLYIVGGVILLGLSVESKRLKNKLENNIEQVIRECSILSIISIFVNVLVSIFYLNIRRYLTDRRFIIFES